MQLNSTFIILKFGLLKEREVAETTKIQQQRQQQISEIEERLNFARTSIQSEKEAMSKREIELSRKANELVAKEKSLENMYGPLLFLII